MKPAIPRIAAALLATSALVTGLSGCSQPSNPHAAAGAATPAAAGSRAASASAPAVTAGVAPGQTGLWGQDIIAVTAQGGHFSHASKVLFEVRNTTVAKSEAFWLKGRPSNGTWTAEFDPADSGAGEYRIVAHGTDAKGKTSSVEIAYTCTIAFEPATKINVGCGDYDVSYGMAGLKVMRIQSYFGNGIDHYPRYLDHTQASVKEFQAAHGLTATGVVDRQTWLALGLDPMEWYTLGTYVSPVAVDANATAAQRIEAMIARAQNYLGDSYVWDASGAPGQGIDCAGLVIQGLYAAGINTGIMNPVTHSTTAWGDQDAAVLYSYCNLTPVDVSAAQRGDLVFYGKDGVVDHVAICLGNNQVIEAHPTGVRTEAMTYREVMGVRRIFV